MNRIKVVNELAELVPMLRAVDTEVKTEVFKEVANEWKTANQIEEKYGREGVEALHFFEKLKLVETKWQTGATASPEKAYHAFYGSFHINATAPVQEISDILFVVVMPESKYKKLEEKLCKLVGGEGKFAGDLADEMNVSHMTLRALVKRSSKLDFRGHRVQIFED
ncbi:MAG: ArsR family transcriptional regulator [Candidatus Hodarchaeota archaeon]